MAEGKHNISDKRELAIKLANWASDNNPERLLNLYSLMGIGNNVDERYFRRDVYGQLPDPYKRNLQIANRALNERKYGTKNANPVAIRLADMFSNSGLGGKLEEDNGSPGHFVKEDFYPTGGHYVMSPRGSKGPGTRARALPLPGYWGNTQREYNNAFGGMTPYYDENNELNIKGQFQNTYPQFMQGFMHPVNIDMNVDRMWED